MRPWVSTWYHYRQLDLTWSWPNVWPQAPGNCDDAMLATSLQAWKKHQPPFAMSGWWLNQPNSKICSSKWVHLPQFSGWTLKKNWNHNLDAIRFTEPFLGARSMIWVGFVPVPWRDSSKDIYIYNYRKNISQVEIIFKRNHWKESTQIQGYPDYTMNLSNKTIWKNVSSQIHLHCLHKYTPKV